MTTPRIIRFLQRPDARETWEYERPPILFVELLCLLAGIWAAPTTQAAWLGAVTAPLALWGAELARADRSAAARKAERAAAMGLPKVELACERAIVQAAKNKQLLTAAAPVVGLAMSVAGAGGAGLTRAAVVGFVVSVVRWAMVELYGVWRRWYRSHVPVRVFIASTGQRFLSRTVVAAADSMSQVVANTKISVDGEGVISVVGPAPRKPTTQLAETSPFQSELIAKTAEEVLRAKGDHGEEFER